MSYAEMYERYPEFKEYVDKYCKKHGVKFTEAILHVIVQAYGDNLMKRKQEVGV